MSTQTEHDIISCYVPIQGSKYKNREKVERHLSDLIQNLAQQPNRNITVAGDFNRSSVLDKLLKDCGLTPAFEHVATHRAGGNLDNIYSNGTVSVSNNVVYATDACKDHLMLAAKITPRYTKA
jgi:hypothetical protein